MATYNSNKANANPKFVETGQIQVSAVFALTAALALNDVVNVCRLPLGAVICDVCISSDTGLDTGSAIAFQVGDQTVANRYINTHAQGGAGTPMAPYHMDNAAGHQWLVDATSNLLQVKVATAPTTGATTGNLRVTVEYSMDP